MIGISLSGCAAIGNTQEVSNACVPDSVREPPSRRLNTIAPKSSSTPFPQATLEAATNGDASAQEQIGKAYLLGDGVRQDFVAAFHWFEKAADQGNTSAQYSLGAMHHYGLGMPSNKAEAMRLYRFAVAKNNVYAMLNLGQLLSEGPPD